MAGTPLNVNIGTISGGIVNFGGAVKIAPVSVTKTVSGSGEGNTGSNVTTANGLSSGTVSDIISMIRRSIE
ncbi:spore germination protein [Neobacillus mesonae]|uniref:spore germination protein n=1 Tax=Neobacillus mesonae TaxID=1193713 RepID=UPI00203A956C|nr:spore germination protein [Neobacillus mesonae]MCM3567746.1 spore germination protein [Neobacillus mesonae]